MSESFTIGDARAFIKEDSLELPFTLKLSKPITLGSETLDSFTFRNEPTAGDVENMPVRDQKMGHFYPVISKMTGETLVSVRKLSFKDMQNCMEIANYFLGGSEEITEEL